MPHHILRHRPQKALLWRIEGVDENGRNIYSAEAEELSVRWEDSFGFSATQTGQQIAKNASVHVDTEIEVGCLMWKGSLEDLEAEVPGTGTGLDTRPVSGIYIVVMYREGKDIKGRIARRTVDLNYFMDTFPDNE